MLLPPLFLQEQGYRAADDRYMIGADLYPRGGAEQYPRAGVRSYGLSSADGVELSFRVTDSTSISGAGTVRVERGAMFVPGRTSLGLNGAYLVVNDAPVTVNLLAAGAAAGVSEVNLYVQVVDPEDAEYVPGSGGASAAVAVFLPLIGTATPPAAALLIAKCVVATTGATGVTDARTYTTGHGGTVQVASTVELATGDMALVPYGSSAYVHGDGLTYTRTKRGWESYGAVRMGKPADGLEYEGEVYYENGAMYLWDGSQWVEVGARPGLVRKQVEQEYTGRRHAMTAVNEFKGKITPGPNWIRTTSLIPVSGLPTSDAATEIRFQVFAPNTMVVAGLSAEVAVKLPDDTAFTESHYGMVALQLLEYISPTAADKNTEYPFEDWAGGAFHYAGMRFTSQHDSMKSRSVLYALDPGEYMVRPMWMATGSGECLLHVSGLCVEVSL